MHAFTKLCDATSVYRQRVVLVIDIASCLLSVGNPPETIKPSNDHWKTRRNFDGRISTSHASRPLSAMPLKNPGLAPGFDFCKFVPGVVETFVRVSLGVSYRQH